MTVAFLDHVFGKLREFLYGRIVSDLILKGFDRLPVN